MMVCEVGSGGALDWRPHTLVSDNVSGTTKSVTGKDVHIGNGLQ